MNKGYLVKSLIEFGGEGDWFLGTILGTNEFLPIEDRRQLCIACENVIFDFLENIESERLEQIIAKARIHNQLYMNSILEREQSGYYLNKDKKQQGVKII